MDILVLAVVAGLVVLCGVLGYEVRATHRLMDSMQREFLARTLAQGSERFAGRYVDNVTRRPEPSSPLRPSAPDATMFNLKTEG